MSVLTIRVKGEKQLVAGPEESTELLSLSASYAVGAVSRGMGAMHDIPLKKQDMVEFVFEDNTRWMSSAEDVREIFSVPLQQQRGFSDEVFEIPASLGTDIRNRGLLGDVALKMVRVFAKKQIGNVVRDRVRAYAIKLQQEQLNNMNGVYRLDHDFHFQNFTAQDSTKPFLLFLHGTASSTHSSFGELKGTPAWAYMTKYYEGNILAFQHNTLTESPLENVRELLRQLPDHCVLHLVSHSRGGLVGDVLSRFCVADEHNAGFSEEECAYLEKSERMDDLAVIGEIRTLVARKNISITKFVRVACPASGTTIASERLDYFFNIVMNLVGLAVGSVANPVYAAFKDLVAAVVDCKDDLTVLPGLEAMNPDSPFLKILNNPAPAATIDGQLLVISGNSQLNLSFKSLVIIATKLFFSSKNDLVVNTASMYNGARRTLPVQCFFDEEVGVDHFHYFCNQKTNEAILHALKATGNNLVPGFHYQQQMFAQERNAILNLEGGQVFRNTVTGKRPIAVLIPGIMGSNLSYDGDLTWINYFGFIRGKLSRLQYTDEHNAKVTAPSLIRTSYKDLADHLSGAYDVVTFPFDWRRQLGETAALFNEKIIELMKYGQPIKIVGHSMGGVLVRDFIVHHNGTWQKLNQSPGFRLLFLGSPLGGSYRIPFVLFGYDEIISKIAKIDLFHTKKELIDIFCNLPGLLSLLPLTTGEGNDFANPQTWKNMAQRSGDASWPVPDKKVLEAFGKYRDHILAQSAQIDWSNAVYVAGRDISTPSGYAITNGKLAFLHTAAGDQSVTWDTGIPKRMIENGSVYYANVTHGGLSCAPSMFLPISDILQKGSTSLLTKSRPLIRAAGQEFVAPPKQDFDLSPQGVENTLLGLGHDAEVIPQGELPIRVSVSNGDLRFAQYPVLVGHFRKDAILNAEKSIDKNLKGMLSDLHRMDLYPGNIGTSELVVLPKSSFRGALIVGLGEQGRLTAFQLTQTVEQGVSKYLVRINNTMDDQVKPVDGSYGLSALLVGCGYGGLSIENSVRAILQGVRNANTKMKSLKPEEVRLVGAVEFVEVYQDKALSCLYTLNKLSSEDSQSLNVSLQDRNIRKLLGSRDRMPIENTDEWWTRITVKQKESDTETCGLQFNISGNGAREEERELQTSRDIIDELLADISTNNRWSPELAKTIYELLIPNDFKEQLKKQSNINWIVDGYTASYPWEMLQEEAEGAKPLSVNAGMIRQLSTQEYRMNVQQVTDNRAFILADPDLKGFVFQLPGAKEEGELVDRLLTAKAFETNKVTGTPGQIIKELFSKPYKIVHLAGHGIFNEDAAKGSGMLIGNDIYLSTKEICQMSAVPELVFVNCCYLGKMDGEVEALYTNRYKLAANIGTQLIRNGVKAVIVAGWAVDDGAAHDFTETFYERMLSGYTFGEAVQCARKEIYDKYRTRNNTWGAYQCYGDPFYKLTQEQRSSGAGDYNFVLAKEAEIELNNLINRLELSGVARETHAAQLQGISAAVDRAMIRTGRITELEAIVYAGLLDYEQAVQRYASLIDMDNADFSFAAMEQYCSVRIRNAVRHFQADPKMRKEGKATAKQVIEDLETLCRYSATAERLNLMGGTYRRIALLSETPEEKLAAYEQAAQCYYKAYLRPGNQNKVHALSSWLYMDNLLVLAGHHKWGAQQEAYKSWTLNKIETTLNDLICSLSAGRNAYANYWDMVTVANLKTCLYLVGKGTYTIDDIKNEYLDIWEHAGAQGKKIAEIELCDLMIDAVSHIPARRAQKINTELTRLREELVKYI